MPRSHPWQRTPVQHGAPVRSPNGDGTGLDVVVPERPPLTTGLPPMRKMINAGLAQGKARSGLAWWGVSLFLGPLATLLIVMLDPVKRP